MTVTEHIRESILNSRGMIELDIPGVPDKHPTLDELKISEWDTEFEGHMRARLIQGAFRYGLLRKKGKDVIYDRVGSAIRRLGKYKDTGNLECLVDVANMMLLEFVEGVHPKRHWHSIDDGEHTGRTK